jgi:microcystin-dependent protein
VSSPYVGEIRMFAGNFAPAGWMFCSGQLLPISEYDVLFNLIGTTYGGDGQSTFALPDLQGRLAVHQGNGFTLAQSGGAETVTLTDAQMPAHTHSFQCSTSPGAQRNPPGNALAAAVGGSAYVQAPATAALASGTIQQFAGDSLPHDNMQPYQCVSFIISLFGVYPTPT